MRHTLLEGVYNVVWGARTIPSDQPLLNQILPAQAGAGTARRTGGTDEREFLRRAAVLGIRVSPYFAASSAYSDEDE